MANFEKKIYCVDEATKDGLITLKTLLKLENNSQALRKAVEIAIANQEKGGVRE